MLTYNKETHSFDVESEPDGFFGLYRNEKLIAIVVKDVSYPSDCDYVVYNEGSFSANCEKFCTLDDILNEYDDCILKEIK